MTKPFFALDIETTEWWNRRLEQVALVQIAYRQGQQSKVAVIDALAPLDLEILKIACEENSIVKIIHNAAFDAPRLSKHFDIKVSPVHDTMLAARSCCERKYSLNAHAQAHLGLNLDKSAQRSDWSGRPLDTKQLFYAALDAHATFLLYENQIGRNLNYIYRSKKDISAAQTRLPLEEFEEPEDLLTTEANRAEKVSTVSNLSILSIALLGIVTELPSRYSPDSLAVSLGLDRVGLAGWIIDRRLGKDADLDELTIKLTIADLYERELLQITDMRRLEASDKGKQIWQDLLKEG